MVRGSRDSLYRNGISPGRRSHQVYRFAATTRGRSNHFKADTRRSQSNASKGDVPPGSEACGMIPTAKRLDWLSYDKILINAQNIFVVAMSPVRVKLGDFGISKRILPQDTTTFHTQVSTQIYGAPEVLGLDSNSETSVYTNAVDIWSLGCVIYELLVGTHLFASGEQVSRYYYRNLPFPEDKLKGLSHPTDDAGISLVKSMLSIQPEDRPTAADALGNAWLVSLKSDSEDSGDDRDETAQSGESSWGRKVEGKLTTHDGPKKKRGKRNLITQDDSEYAPGDVSLGANPGLQWDSDPTASKSAIIDTTITALTDVASTGSSLTQKGSMKLGLVADASQTRGDSFQGPQDAAEKTDPQCSTNMSPK